MSSARTCLMRSVSAAAVTAALVAMTGCGSNSDSSGSTKKLSLVGFSILEGVNKTAIADFDKTSAGKGVGFTTSYGASGDQSRAVAAGLKAEKRAGMRVHGRTGEPCPVCGDTVRQVAFATKSLQYCPTCQTGGRPLADRRLSRLLK